MLLGGHLTTSLVEQFPAPRWTGSNEDRRIARLSVCVSRRPESSRLTAALQAAVAQRYGLTRGSFAHVLEGFPLVADDERALAHAFFVRAS
jgi:hypothetical protein